MALRIVAFVIPLGFDTFAVAVALGLRGIPPLRPALLFAVFEAAMPLIGIVAGRYVGLRFESLAVYLGSLILIGLGIHTLREAQESEHEELQFSFASARGIVLAGIGVSTDEIAVGFPLGALGLPIPAVLTAIAMQAFVVTIVGILLGSRIGMALGRQTSRIAAVLAGIAFVLLGGFLLVERVVRHAA